MKKFRCPKCGTTFQGKLSICPNCGINLHYRDAEVREEEAKATSTFNFEDERVLVEKENVPETISSIPLAPNIPQEYHVKEYDGASKFDGVAIARTGYIILAFLITVCTAFIAFPWAMCMVCRWETKHTVIGGRRLSFDGKGIQLFGRWLLWILLTILTAGIFLIWLRVYIKKWRIKHTRFKDEYFGK